MSKIVSVQGIDVKYKRINEKDYISLSDIARFREGEYPSDVIRTWLRTYRTIEFLGIWEKLHNPNFNSVEFDRVKDEAPENGFVMTPKRWVETTNAIGIIQSMGKYADILAHKDIAFKFASWLSVEFELYMVKEFQRLKENEQAHLQWSAKRELAKVNYHIHTDAIKENIVPTLTDKQKNFVYADEADLLNVALFGMTASEWRAKNPNRKANENIRDYADIHQLIVLSNMESYNAIMIADKLPQDVRMERLNQTARQQLQVLTQVENKFYLPKK